MRQTEKTGSDGAAAPRYPTLKAAWWLVAVLFITACISYADRLVLSVLVDPLRQSLGLSDSAVGVLQGPAFTLVYVFSSLFFGRLADRKNRRRIILVGATVWCLATLLCGIAQGFTWLLMARMLVGISEAALLPAAISMIADSFAPARRGTAVGLFAMGTAIGGPLGITIGGVLLSAADGGVFASLPFVGPLESWRAVLVMMGVLGLVSPLLMLTLREPVRLELAQDSSSAAAVRYVVGERRLLLPLYLGMALLAIGDYGLVSWVPTALTRRFEWSADQVGLYFGVITSLAGILGAVCGGWLSDFGARFGGGQGRLTISAVAAVCATTGAIAISGNDPISTLAGLGLWVFASTVASIGGIAVLQQVVPSQFRGTGVSIFTFCNTLLGLGCGPSLVGLTTDHVFGSPVAVGFAISTIVVPAGALAVTAILLCRRQLGSLPNLPRDAQQIAA